MRNSLFKIIQIVSFDFFFQLKKKNNLLIFLFHGINDKKNKYYPTIPIEVFDKTCEFISRNFNVINLSELSSYYSKTNKPAVVLSFDDGLYDVIEFAWPVLKKYGLKFNVNIDTEILETKLPQDFIRVFDALNQTEKKEYNNSKYFDKPVVIDGINSYKTEFEFAKKLSLLKSNDRREFANNVIEQLCGSNIVFTKVLSKDDVFTLFNNGAEIGSHSHSHANLTKITPKEVKFELVKSRRILSEIIDKNVEILAYPNGYANMQVEQIAYDAGYKYFLLLGDRRNKIEPHPQNSFHRFNLHHQSFEENIANIHGFHAILNRIIQK